MGKKRRIPEVRPDLVRTLHGSFPEETLDLHGLTGEQADRRVRDFVETWRRRPGAVIRIVTGKGLRSQGAAVLRPLLRELLTGALRDRVEEFVEEAGGGSFLVRLR